MKPAACPEIERAAGWFSDGEIGKGEGAAADSHYIVPGPGGEQGAGGGRRLRGDCDKGVSSDKL